MEEVSSRIFAFYSEAAARRGVRRGELAEGLPSVEKVIGGASWYDWHDHVRMLERFQSYVGGPAAADQIALESNERRVAEPLRLLAGTIADVKLLYRAGFWFGSSLYRHVTFSITADGPVLRIGIEVPEDYEGSEIFFRMWRGTLRGTPRMLGLPDATVTSEIGSHRGVFNVLVPEGRDVLSRARRVVRVARTGAVLVRHLERHQQELRAAYDGLLRSRQDFREIANNTPDALMLLRSGVIVYANPAAEAAIGGGRLADAVNPNDQRLVAAWLAEAEAIGNAGRLDFRVGPRTYEAEAARAVDFAGHGAILVVARDVSDRQASEDRLRRSEQDKQGLLEAVPDLIVRITQDGFIASVAGQRTHPIGPLLRRHVGKPLRALEADLEELPVDLAPRLRRGAASSRPEAYVVETSVRLGAERLHLEWRGVAIEDGGIVCLVRDRSHQRKMEAELAVAERLASLGMLAAGVGHEINNPLAYLLLQLRLLEKAIGGGAHDAHDGRGSELAAHVKAALDGAGHIERVVRAMKSLAQPVPEAHHPVDVNQVIDEIVRLTENRMPSGSTLRREYEDGVFALADEGPLATVVGNLFVNAADAIAKTGGPGEICLSTRALRDFVEIEVADDGVGMPPEAIERAFDPFFTTKRASGGLGLGLTLAHRMITALGGTIAIRPRTRRGTTIVIRLERSAAPEKVEAKGARPLRFDGLSVLVIDDQPNLVTTLRMLLDECAVTAAGCGEEALAAVKKQPFDVVLCDIVMPDLDGLGIYERLERLAPPLLSRLIFMTGGATRPEIAAFLARIPNACLQKPFSEEQLRDVMANTIGGAFDSARSVSSQD